MRPHHLLPYLLLLTIGCTSHQPTPDHSPYLAAALELTSINQQPPSPPNTPQAGAASAPSPAPTPADRASPLTTKQENQPRCTGETCQPSRPSPGRIKRRLIRRR